MSELDEQRRRALVAVVRRGGQVLVTTTDLRYFSEEELSGCPHRGSHPSAMNPRRTGDGDLTPLGELIRGTRSLASGPDPRRAPGRVATAARSPGRRLGPPAATSPGEWRRCGPRPWGRRSPPTPGRSSSTEGAWWCLPRPVPGRRACTSWVTASASVSTKSLRTDEIRTVFFRHAGWEAARDQAPDLQPPDPSAAAAQACGCRRADPPQTARGGAAGVDHATRGGSERRRRAPPPRPSPEAQRRPVPPDAAPPAPARRGPRAVPAKAPP